jgi:hypothetical protein
MLVSGGLRNGANYVGAMEDKGSPFCWDAYLIGQVKRPPRFTGVNPCSAAVVPVAQAHAQAHVNNSGLLARVIP